MKKRGRGVEMHKRLGGGAFWLSLREKGFLKNWKKDVIKKKGGEGKEKRLGGCPSLSFIVLFCYIFSTILSIRPYFN